MMSHGDLSNHHSTYTFPNGFLWGAATAAHQVEGNNINRAPIPRVWLKLKCRSCN